jgi:4-amino-4-deoxy-L-arabinose transferase-like glycosyltransferase
LSSFSVCFVISVAHLLRHKTHRLTHAGTTGPWWWQWEIAAISLLVVVVYFSRLTALPICGEESRWANAAREMIVSGDWIVLRQQGSLFAERPPLGSWAMALVGLVRGEVDLVAVRLPSALAVLALVWLIYWYASGWMSRAAALVSAVIFATFGQVMVLGRFGETEAVFTLFTAGSLLVWHVGYLRGWPTALVWTLGYSLAALGALAKGLQAPVYFVAATCIYLAARRDWRRLFGTGHLAGLAAFAIVVGAWMVPFAREARGALDDVWAGLVQDRFTLAGLLPHVAAYPFETFGCLLPWSPLLIGLLKPSVRKSIVQNRPEVLFLVVALAVTYPTVWLAAGARGRYYMPLYPLVAVVMGLVVEHCTTRWASRGDFLLWRMFLVGLAVAALGGGAALVAASVLGSGPLAAARQSPAFLVPWCLAAATGIAVAMWAARGRGLPRAQAAVLSAAVLVGFAYAGAALNVRLRAGNELAPAVAEIKRQLPDPNQLVSLGRVYHRFAYSYETPIRQVPWPIDATDLPPDVTYFCFDRRPADTPQDRAGNDDRLGAHTPGVLPFAWEKIADIPCDPVKRDEAHRWVVIGRVRRNERVAAQPSKTQSR